MALGQLLDGLSEPAQLHLPYDRAGYLGGALVLDQLAYLRGVRVRAQWLVKTGGVRQRALDVPDLLHRPLEASRNLLVGGLALRLRRELIVDTGHLADLVPHMHRNPDRTTLVRDGTLHGLPYPPGGVGGEPPAPVGVELLHGLHQADVALLDEVLEGQSHPAVLLGHANHEPQVLLDEPLPGPHVAGLGPHGEVYLLLVREEIALANVREVLGKELGGFGFPLDFLGVPSLV